MMYFSSINKVLLILGLFIFFLKPLSVYSQSTRLSMPNRSSKIKSTDDFVKNTFKLYDKVFVYDSLTVAGVEIPPELEEELLESAERDIDSLWEVVPNIVDDIGDASFMKQARATLNLNKAKKALKYCANYVKTTILGKKEED
ncbi:hypothetical protein APS56_03885 [Pseudalgibacter alginicilyticus]|uniref:Uncharacterized protein n=1 Tax=Pseudalgibacter alginicilyticus TaxID=1736674 RepID=A0A0P0D329_9FLAO|nr:hypothetical protein [Pseudalgibacter alginicilyticus]ALJ04333.1 hypothetical protein APS56_03885 [Pseudalgibacter alginicilyticus]